MEDYEKKYKEALAKAREIHRNEAEKRFDMEWLFPELKESEDERVKKRILLSLEKDLMAIKNSGCGTQDLEQCIAWLEKQGNNTPTIIWHNIDEKPEEMKELFCEWESDDSTWHDVAFYDEESHTFRHAKMPINVTKWVYVDELLEKQSEQKPAVTDFNAKDWYVSKVDGKIHDMTYNPADKVEPRFKVKYAGSEYNVLEVKDIAGVTFYGIEDEPNHIDYVKAENCEIISGYAIKENCSPYPTKPAVFSEKKPTAWSDEDENYLQSAENACEYQYGKNTSTILWLKSLKDRIEG